MSNKTTFQEKNARLNNNNTDLSSILDTINNLPNASSGGGVSRVGGIFDIPLFVDENFFVDGGSYEFILLDDAYGIAGTGTGVMTFITEQYTFALEGTTSSGQTFQYMAVNLSLLGGDVPVCFSNAQRSDTNVPYYIINKL